ncbi:DedA family protein [Bordetella sp. BOR01]|uniref:DedA family protein n=1 Tax=Bordetella sp. BOR01 TaxID=2854779 RepID=UPI001C437332|nr:DedA family protein [Bordetella sp. BOR01]MBV7483047.1 DedA family protein [Bordetella sp. BOR01]
MPPHEWIAQYGVLLVFLNVLGSSLGLPLPVMPTLIAVGACHALGTTDSWTIALSLSFILGAAVLAGVMADLVWFVGGMRYGPRTLNKVCSLTLSREACVSKTEKFFERWGVRLLIVARFVPGLSLVAVPLCGAMGVRLRSVIWHDCAGVALWASVGLALGATFAAQVQDLLAALSAMGWQALIAAVAAVALYMAYRYARRASVLRNSA